MELLAPAGSKESFIAAIRAGADSVYIGVDKYNARLKANVYNIYDIEVAVDYAHSHDKKIYLALNTLIKHDEIDDVVKILYRINKFKPDAIIVQDIGIARIIQEQFPEISIHGSTQMAVHNSYGVETLSKLGFNRVILARELSFSELKLIARKSPIGLEVFCHGALCFCISGMCLFSSFIGAHSGNRGRCTQPCRRIWTHGTKQGYFFSPKDLELAEHVQSLKKIGIKTLKIEGRMRSSEYVHNTVKAYRLLIDADESNFVKTLKEAKKILLMDWARDKTTFLFSGKNHALFRPHESQCLGKKIGCVIKSTPGIISIETTESIQPGDRIRISDPQHDITKTLKINDFSNSGNTYNIPFPDENFPSGSQVFKAGDSRWNEKDITKEVNNMYSSYATKLDNKHSKGNAKTDYSNTYTALIARQWIIKDKASHSSGRLWVRIDDPAWIELLPENTKNFNIVFSLKRENIHIFNKVVDTNTVCELTPYISQREIPEYQQIINNMIASGISRWVLNNISQLGFFSTSDGIEKIAGHFLYTWNAFTARTLKDMGVSYFVTSWEDDILNIRKLAGSGLRGYMIVYLYGYPPVVRSRMLTKDTYADPPRFLQNLCRGTPENKDNFQVRLVYESGAGILIPNEPVMLFNAREKIGSLGIRNFGIDLSYIKPERDTWEKIYNAYQEKTNFPDSIKFNFKRTVK